MIQKATLKAVDYPQKLPNKKPHSDYLDVAVRRATVTGVNQTAAKLQETLADEVGSDLVETTAHSGARPSHAEWQGKVFSRSGKHKKYPHFATVTGYGTGAGLCGWNCRHSFFPFFEGMDPVYSKEELAELNAKNVEYDGKKYTEYEISQIQRSYERGIRKSKREIVAAKAADLPEIQKKAEASLAQYQARQAALIKQTGVKRQYERERVINNSLKSPLKVLTNASGAPIIRVKQADVKLQGKPNTITQTRSGKGGINRNYYDENGNQYKQISNNHHNHKAVMEFGKQGEHAHDYIYSDDGKTVERPYRELTDEERKENADIL